MNKESRNVLVKKHWSNFKISQQYSSWRGPNKFLRKKAREDAELAQMAAKKKQAKKDEAEALKRVRIVH